VGLQTGDNDRFVRLWQEVSSDKFYIDAPDASTAMASGKKWFPYTRVVNFVNGMAIMTV